MDPMKSNQFESFWLNFRLGQVFHLVQGQEWKVEMLMGIIGNLTLVLVAGGGGIYQGVI